MNTDLIPVDLFGSSHALESNFFHAALHFLWALPKYQTARRRYIFLDQAIDAQGGRAITNSLVLRIIRNITARAAANPQGHLTILILGSNNIRIYQQHPDHVILFFRTIIMHAEATPHSHVLLVGLVPDAGADAHTREGFRKLNTLFAGLASEFPQSCTFAPVAKLFTHFRVVRDEFFQRMDGNDARTRRKRRERDDRIARGRQRPPLRPELDCHLNFEGQKLFVGKILQVMGSGISRQRFT